MTHATSSITRLVLAGFLRAVGLAAGAGLCALSAAAYATASPAAHAPADSVRRSYIVQGRSVEAAERAVNAAGGRVLNELAIIDAVGAELQDTQAARLRSTAGVRLYTDRTVDARGKTTTFVSGTSPSVNLNQFYTNYPMLVGADQLHTAGITGAGVTVAFLDSGLWKNNVNDHYGKRLLAMLDFVGSANAVAYTGDDSGHGTHVTSIALSGDSNNSGQYYGIAPKANVVIARAFQANGSASYLDVIKALNWILANKDTYKIRVLNLSFGACLLYTSPSPRD